MSGCCISNFTVQQLPVCLPSVCVTVTLVQFTHHIMQMNSVELVIQTQSLTVIFGEVNWMVHQFHHSVTSCSVMDFAILSLPSQVFYYIKILRAAVQCSDVFQIRMGYILQTCKRLEWLCPCLCFEYNVLLWAWSPFWRCPNKQVINGEQVSLAFWRREPQRKLWSCSCSSRWRQHHHPGCRLSHSP